MSSNKNGSIPEDESMGILPSLGALEGQMEVEQFRSAITGSNLPFDEAEVMETCLINNTPEIQVAEEKQDLQNGGNIERDFPMGAIANNNSEEDPKTISQLEPENEEKSD